MAEWEGDAGVQSAPSSWGTGQATPRQSEGEGPFTSTSLRETGASTPLVILSGGRRPESKDPRESRCNRGRIHRALAAASESARVARGSAGRVARPLLGAALRAASAFVHLGRLPGLVGARGDGLRRCGSRRDPSTAFASAHSAQDDGRGWGAVALRSGWREGRGACSRRREERGAASAQAGGKRLHPRRWEGAAARLGWLLVDFVE